VLQHTPSCTVHPPCAPASHAPSCTVHPPPCSTRLQWHSAIPPMFQHHTLPAAQSGAWEASNSLDRPHSQEEVAGAPLLKQAHQGRLQGLHVRGRHLSTDMCARACACVCTCVCVRVCVFACVCLHAVY